VFSPETSLAGNRNRITISSSSSEITDNASSSRRHELTALRNENADQEMNGGSSAKSQVHADSSNGNNTISITKTNETTSQLRLPDMTKGGVIFVLHVPKTGGSTVRDNFENATSEFGRNVDYIFAQFRYEVNCDLVRRIEEYLSEFRSVNRPQRVLFVEVHGQDTHHALELEPMIDDWRRGARRNQVPFFAYTILREAVPLQISFFNYYRIAPGDCRFQQAHKKWPIHVIANKLLVKWSYENPQCLFLARGERTYGERSSSSCHTMWARRTRWGKQITCQVKTKRKPKPIEHVKQSHRRTAAFPIEAKRDMERLRQNLTRDECLHAYSVLQSSMDYIAVLERSNGEIFPMLTTMLYKDPDMAG
jgi:hypothetical protein